MIPDDPCDFPDDDRLPRRYATKARSDHVKISWKTIVAFAMFAIGLVIATLSFPSCAGPSQDVQQTGAGNTSEQTEQLFRDIAPKLVELTTQYGNVRDIVTNDWQGYAALAAVFFGGTYLTTKYGARGLVLFIQLVVQALTTNRTITGKVGKPPANKTDEPPTNNP